MLPSPSSSPHQVLHERTNAPGTPVQSRLLSYLPTPPTDKRVVSTSPSRKRKLVIAKGDPGVFNVAKLRSYDDDIVMEDDPFQPVRSSRYSPFDMRVRAAMGMPGRRREMPSTRAILQSLVSSNKSDIYKCESTCVDGYLTPPYACSYTNGAKNGRVPLLAVATEQGTVYIFDTSKRRAWEPEPSQATLQIHENGVFDVKWNTDDTLLATCSGDQSTRISSPNTETVLYSLRGHTSTVKCAAWDPSNANLLSTGGRDGGICLWDLRMVGNSDGDGLTVLSPVMSITGAHEDSSFKARRRGKKVPAPRSVTSLLYPEVGTYGLISSGSSDGILKHWDPRLLANGKKRTKPKVPESLHSSPMDPTTLNGSRRPRGMIKLITGTGPTAGLVFGLGADSRVHIYDLPCLTALPTSYSHESMQTNSFYVGLTLSPCGRWLATGSGATGNDVDTRGSVFVFDVSDATHQERPVSSRAGIRLQCQQGEVGAVDWAADILASCADDGTVRAWRPDIDIYRQCIRQSEESRWDWSWHS